MNKTQSQIFGDTLRRYGKTFFGLGAGFCYLLAGQPQTAVAATKDNKMPQKRNQNIAKLINELNAKCEKTSLLDKLKAQPEKENLLEAGDNTVFLVGTDTCPGFTIPAGTYTGGSPYTDAGTTVGANNTVTAIQSGCSTYTTVQGPDMIYRLRLPPLGSRPAVTSITVTPSGGYDSAIYLLSSVGTSCPAGTGNSVTNCVTGKDAAAANGAETITDAQLDALPGGTFYLFIDSFYATGSGGAPNRHNGPYTLNLVGTVLAPTAASATVGGRVQNTQGLGIARVTVMMTDGNGQTRTALTNQFGFYNFDNIEVGGTYIFQISSKKYQFSNPTQVVSVSDNIADLNFTAIE